MGEEITILELENKLYSLK